MASFGENLRRERELRGITLAELANATKISLRHLQALEGDQLDDLPGGVFNRGFVRAVARYMKLDEHYWVGEYVRAAHEEPEVLARYAPPPLPRPPSRHRALGSFVLLIMLFGGGAYVIHQVRLRRAAEAASSVPTSPVSLPQTESGADAAPAQPALPQPSAPVGTPTTLPVAAKSPAASEEQPVELLLQVDVLEDAWVTVTVDSQPLYRGLMRPGESRHFRAGRRIELTTGNASAVVLTLNGETLAPLGNPGERKNIVLTAKDLRPPAP